MHGQQNIKFQELTNTTQKIKAVHAVVEVLQNKWNLLM